ncbi:hypothetical protein SBRY_40707 [Actinacidiphila bryophytorum]|uniref:Uncharacterized protein n=1 Tax=Actinacidiphila bryophytorum TaxID=1436133 RepID=A0A9W4H3K9_9ACTN|nr:hypothetical protein SBRY_40707 [Actinacidiphila bryophytorum]
MHQCRRLAGSRHAGDQDLRHTQRLCESLQRPRRDWRGGRSSRRPRSRRRRPRRRRMREDSTEPSHARAAHGGGVLLVRRGRNGSTSPQRRDESRLRAAAWMVRVDLSGLRDYAASFLRGRIGSRESRYRSRLIRRYVGYGGRYLHLRGGVLFWPRPRQRLFQYRLRWSARRADVEDLETLLDTGGWRATWLSRGWSQPVGAPTSATESTGSCSPTHRADTAGTTARPWSDSACRAAPRTRRVVGTVVRWGRQGVGGGGAPQDPRPRGRRRRHRDPRAGRRRRCRSGLTPAGQRLHVHGLLPHLRELRRPGPGQRPDPRPGLHLRVRHQRLVPAVDALT